MNWHYGVWDNQRFMVNTQTAIPGSIWPEPAASAYWGKTRRAAEQWLHEQFLQNGFPEVSEV